MAGIKLKSNIIEELKKLQRITPYVAVDGNMYEERCNDGLHVEWRDIQKIIDKYKTK